jgi:RNA polymerase sigma-70 factor (ECF subfamily)
MAARITRAKKKIAVARIPYRVVPRHAELPERLRLIGSQRHSPALGSSGARAE